MAERGAAEWTKPVYVMACDLVAYTDMLPVDQKAAKAKIERWQASAVPKGAKWLGWADAGDGGYLLLDSDSPDCALEALKLFQAKTAAEGPLDFRYCLHHGMVSRQPGTGGDLFSGDGMNEAARILGGMEKGTVGQVVCSSAYARLLEREVGTGFELTRLADVAGKRGEVFEAWDVAVANGPGAPPRPTIRFETNDEMREWLEAQPREVITGFASRASLRIAPLHAENPARKRFYSELTLSSFCALAVSWFASKWPEEVVKIRAQAVDIVAACAVACKAHEAVASIPYGAARDAADDARLAVLLSNSAASAARATAIAPTSIEPSVSAAIGAIHAANKAAERCFVTKSAAVEVHADAARAMHGGSDELLTAPLWNIGGNPLLKQWSQLKSIMHADGAHWSVWTSWYEAREVDAPASKALELARIKCIEGVDLRDAEEVNRRIQAAIDAHQPQAEAATPISRPPKIEEESGDIARRRNLRETTDQKDSLTLHRQYVERIGDVIEYFEPAGENDEFHPLRPALAGLRKAVERPYDANIWAEKWLQAFEDMRTFIAMLSKEGAITAPRKSPQLTTLLAAMTDAENEINETFEEIRDFVQSLRARRFRQLTEEELEAVEASLKAFTDIAEDSLQRELGEDVEGIRKDIEAIKAKGDDPLYTLPDGPQKARLYRLKALFLRMRRLAKTSPEELTRILDKGVDVTKKIQQYEKAAETLDKYWDTLRHWFIGGA